MEANILNLRQIFGHPFSFVANSLANPRRRKPPPKIWLAPIWQGAHRHNPNSPQAFISLPLDFCHPCCFNRPIPQPEITHDEKPKPPPLQLSAPSPCASVKGVRASCHLQREERSNVLYLLNLSTTSPITCLLNPVRSLLLFLLQSLEGTATFTYSFVFLFHATDRLVRLWLY
jgi:hypothetical protein